MVWRHIPPAPGCQRGPDSWPRKPASSCQVWPPSVVRKSAASSTPAYTISASLSDGSRCHSAQTPRGAVSRHTTGAWSEACRFLWRYRKQTCYSRPWACRCCWWMAHWPNRAGARSATIVGALDDLPEPAAGLGGIDAVGINRRALDVVNLPTGKVRAGNRPLLRLPSAVRMKAPSFVPTRIRTSLMVVSLNVTDQIHLKLRGGASAPYILRVNPPRHCRFPGTLYDRPSVCKQRQFIGLVVSRIPAES